MREEPRRRERAMESRREMEALLERMAVGGMAMITKEGPYVVPVNYLFAENCIYVHSGPRGKKVEALRADPRVCFLVDEPGPRVTWERGCGISQIYESVMCFGKAEFVEKPEEKRRILEMMVGKFVPDEIPSPLKDQSIENTTIVKILIEWMTGKANRITPVHTIVSNHLQPTTK
jgi:nitroimidazol reductase NimA-like FMN-containing flavoprotein (pyridoxamine 5'-phosphate oxidase superfamily)